MFSLCSAFFAVSLLNSLHDIHVSSCDENCADKPVFTPSRLVVKFGDPTSAECSGCQHDCQSNTFGLEMSVGEATKNGTRILWEVDSLTEWDLDNIQCYNTDDDGNQCCSSLPVTVYQPPKSVSFSFLNQAGPMFAGHEYKVQCNIQEVVPVGNLNVTFYRGQTELDRLQSNNTEKTPVNETFTLDIIPSNEDDGEQYWCEAKLDLGAEGPQPPPVVESGKLTATVYYEPQLKVSSHPDLITVTEGDLLQLNCSAVGNPRPSYNWTLPSASGSHFNDSVFTVEPVTLKHKGQYTCSVHNDIGNVTVKFNVDVKYEPQLKVPSHPDPITLTKGDRLQLDCSAVGNPSPSYNWTLPSASDSPFSGDILTIESVTLEDKGQYTCSVYNDIGDVNRTFNVDIKYEPQLKVPSHPEPITLTKGDRLQLNCSAVGNPRPSYNWTLPSASDSPFSGDILTIESVTLEHKGQYTCSVYNDIGAVTRTFNVDIKKNYTVIILLGLLVLVLVAVVIIIVYVYKYKQRQKGEYNVEKAHYVAPSNVTVAEASHVSGQTDID